MDRKHDQLISRFSLDTIFPIDIVVVEPISSLWGRYHQTLEIAALLGLALVGLWVYGIWRYSRYRMSLASELREALRKGWVEVQYQPVIDLASGRCIGAEALARWRRDDGELVNQDVFIRVVEDTGLGAMLTQRVLESTLRELGELLREQPLLSINLNLTPEDLKGNSFREFLESTLATARVAPRSIKLEITERALVNHAEVRALIRTFRKRGHKVAVDDFGTGYSSLSYLESFELDTLKIDKSFVNVIGKEAVTSHVIFHVIEMAKDLGLEIVAEGAETLDQVQWLQQQGVHCVQGFFFSEPLSAAQFEEFIRSNHATVLPLIPGKKHTRTT
ncbi:MAG: EAL domain-containing protein [Terriglobia bacterium]